MLISGALNTSAAFSAGDIAGTRASGGAGTSISKDALSKNSVGRDAVRGELSARSEAASTGSGKTSVRTSVSDRQAGSASMNMQGFKSDPDFLNEFQRANVEMVKRFTV